MRKIVIGPSSFAQLNPKPLEVLNQAGFEVIDNPFKRRLTETEIINLLDPDVDGLLAGLEPLNKNVLSKSHLKVISRVGAGMDNVDLNAAKQLGIEVRNTPYGPTKSVAELTLAAMLNLLRLIPQMNSALHNQKWDKRIGFQLEKKTVVIIGFGRIGKQVAEYLKPFNTKIIVVDPYLKENDTQYDLMSLQKALPMADIVTLHLSGKECLIEENEFDLMKEGVFILNSARGGILSEQALKTALDNKKVAGAWLDAFETEPYNGPLSNYENVLLTPHAGSYTIECRLQMEIEAVENLIDSFNKIQ